MPLAVSIRSQHDTNRQTMKRFIDDKGTFEIQVPITWKYSIKDGKVHTFQEYEIWKSDAFQLSIIHLDSEKKRTNFRLVTKNLKVSTIEGKDFYSFPDSSDDELTTKHWTALYGDKAVQFTLTYLNNPDPDLDNRSINDKVQTVHSIIKEFKLIDGAKSIEIINSYRFDMFLQGVGATALILSNAVKNKAFIEATCILANQIDALLRTGIVLKNQIINGNRKIEIEWIYQGLTDKKKSEKDVYKKALNLGIIDKTIIDELFALYEDRNRVMHRFIISEITLAEVEDIAYQYYQEKKAITQIIYNIESEQISLNVGMTTKGSIDPNEGNHLDYIKGKIGIVDYFEDKKKDE